MNQRRFLFFVFLSVFGSVVSAQTEMMDTLRTALQYKPKPLVGFGGRNSFIQNSRADIWGINAGISLHKRVRIGAGYNYMSSDLTQVLNFNDQTGVAQSVLMHMKLRYVSAYFEYVYFKNKHWEFSIPVQMGFGNSEYVFSFKGTNYERDNQSIVLYEPMVQTDYYIFSWLGVEADVGLRLMLKNNQAIGKNFNSPMYAFGMFIAWDQLYKTLFPNTRLAGKL